MQGVVKVDNPRNKKGTHVISIPVVEPISAECLLLFAGGTTGRACPVVRVYRPVKNCKSSVFYLSNYQPDNECGCCERFNLFDG